MIIITNLITTYTAEHLGPFLRSKEVSENTVAAVTHDIDNRLASLLSRWNDDKFRSTLLLTALEEGTFYMPFHPEINGLVVLAVRNSPQLDNLHHTEGILDNTDIRKVTSQAIQYFAEVDLTQAADQVTARPDDVFATLPTTYPLAWEAFHQLAGATRLPKTYEPQPADLADLPDLDQVVDGELLQDLTQIQHGEISFLFRDSFKMLSRNLDQLFYVIEYVLRANKTLITHNFYLSNGMVSRRNPVLKPAQKPIEIAKKFENKKGLVSRHKDSLRLIKKFIVPPASEITPEIPSETASE
ncbi:hypothetical protein CIG75_14280 [Tumebacillus algifaecis]|uniref:Uncharacterized protein n=1 Tax=Tumebacillus algifaecis TaxID=1214604 RepID=A0A223D3E1_9BACL|nr:hypothetical protein [Tumebacillus algifaecis]ASS76015.1 hypothetical protein CIG75_14280 [Tumebacillus algifaecis]